LDKSEGSKPISELVFRLKDQRRWGRKGASDDDYRV